ncbi:MAG: BACON domain-containing protein [Bacteroides sp.]|nr:BACON domain-containing protein [Bacteroides sp.]
MKKLSICILVAAWSLILGSCGDDETYMAEKTLDIAESTVDFWAVGGEGVITLNNVNDNVTAESSAGWCTIVGVSAGKISYTVSQNTTMETRTATIYITASDATGQVSVTQAGFFVDYELETFYAYADNAAFNCDIKFTGDIDITADVDADAADWLSCEKVTGGYVVSAGTNTTGEARLGKVSIQAGEMKKVYSFLQYAATDFCREWNASYTTATGEAGSGVWSIASTETEGIFSMVMQGEEYNAFQAYYQDGAVKIPGYQYLGQQQGYPLYLGILSASGYPAISADVTYQLKPCLLADGNWGLAFVDDGSYSEAISALAVWAVSDGTVAGYWEYYNDVILSQ